MSDKAPRYQRILLKLSGEALAGKIDEANEYDLFASFTA